MSCNALNSSAMARAHDARGSFRSVWSVSVDSGDALTYANSGMRLLVIFNVIDRRK